MSAQSLQNFEKTIAEVLALDEIQEWDGRTLKQREEQIRQAALILAGQCIALLLHNINWHSRGKLISQLLPKCSNP